jgi:hypothetical protein
MARGAGTNDAFSIGYYSQPDLPFYNAVSGVRSLFRVDPSHVAQQRVPDPSTVSAPACPGGGDIFGGSITRPDLISAPHNPWRNLAASPHAQEFIARTGR